MDAAVVMFRWLCRLGLHWWRSPTTTTRAWEDEAGRRTEEREQVCWFCGERRWREC